jgi:hypothetical protein
MPERFTACCTICQSYEDEYHLLFACSEKLMVWQYFLTLETGEIPSIEVLVTAVLDWHPQTDISF